MHLLFTLYVAVLFFVLTPGVLLSLPNKGSKYMVAATHALVFAVLYHLTHKLVWNRLYEGFLDCPTGQYSKKMSVKTATGTVMKDTCVAIPPASSAAAGIKVKCGTNLTFNTTTGAWGC